VKVRANSVVLTGLEYDEEAVLPQKRTGMDISIIAQSKLGRGLYAALKNEYSSVPVAALAFRLAAEVTDLAGLHSQATESLLLLLSVSREFCCYGV